jgi:uncharacterized protein
MRLDLDRTPRGLSALGVDDECDLGFGATGPQRVQISGELRVDNLEGHCLLRGELTARGPVSCDRCQKEFIFDFPVGVQLMILRDAGRQGEDDDGETVIIHQRDGIVDLHDALREAALLGVPISRICRAECRGLCSHCGVDLNEADCACAETEPDPRWDGLPE